MKRSVDAEFVLWALTKAESGLKITASSAASKTADFNTSNLTAGLSEA
jgi:hypothetical protein